MYPRTKFGNRPRKEQVFQKIPTSFALTKRIFYFLICMFGEEAEQKTILFCLFIQADRIGLESVFILRN